MIEIKKDKRRSMVNNLSDLYVKTRKEHKCWGCLRIIPIGNNARKITCKDNGILFSSYWCNICSDFMNKLDAYEVELGFTLGELREVDGYNTFKQTLEEMNK